MSVAGIIVVVSCAIQPNTSTFNFKSNAVSFTGQGRNQPTRNWAKLIMDIARPYHPDMVISGPPIITDNHVCEMKSGPLNFITTII